MNKIVRYAPKIFLTLLSAASLNAEYSTEQATILYNNLLLEILIEGVFSDNSLFWQKEFGIIANSLSEEQAHEISQKWTLYALNANNQQEVITLLKTIKTVFEAIDSPNFGAPAPERSEYWARLHRQLLPIISRNRTAALNIIHLIADDDGLPGGYHIYSNEVAYDTLMHEENQSVATWLLIMNFIGKAEYVVNTLEDIERMEFENNANTGTEYE